MDTKPKTGISWITLAFIMVAAVASIRSLPGMAIYGLGSIFLYLLPALVFFLPVSLIAAELATGWNGGIYGWVKQAFGERMGFFVMWYLWVQTVTWYPIVLAFAASTIAFLFNPELAKSGIFNAAMIVILYWLSTMIALRGLRGTSKLSSWFMILGTLLPALVLIILGITWFILGRKSAAPLTLDALIPNIFHSSTTVHAGAHKLHTDFWQTFSGTLAGIVLIVSNFLAYAGIEMNAIHVRQLKNPQKQVPKALLVAFVLILLIFIPPTLAISFVVPSDSTSLTAGVMQAYSDFFRSFNMDWAIKIVAILLIIGALGGVLTWVAGPSTGLLFVARSGSLPRWWQEMNEAGVQKNILIIQGILVTILAAFYLVVPDVSGAFWMLSALAAQMYLIIYVLMFAAALRLRKTQANVRRGFVAPAIHLWAGLGIVSSIFAFLLGFITPAQFKMLPPVAYVLTLLGGLVLFGLPPFIFYACRKPTWQVVSKAESEKYSAALQDLDTDTTGGDARN